MHTPSSFVKKVVLIERWHIFEGFDAAPVIQNGRTLVPIRYVAEKLDANVIWVPATQQIIIVK
ncbi:MAG: stalk domain-containing protein [Peptococcaceae bacterium]